MPANPKYLSSPIQRFAKISAGLVGGYFVAITFHLALAVWFDQVKVIITLTFTGFILWAMLFVVAFLVKNGWKVWLIYILVTAIFCLIIFLGRQAHL